MITRVRAIGGTWYEIKASSNF